MINYSDSYSHSHILQVLVLVLVLVNLVYCPSPVVAQRRYRGEREPVWEFLYEERVIDARRRIERAKAEKPKRQNKLTYLVCIHLATVSYAQVIRFCSHEISRHVMLTDARDLGTKELNSCDLTTQLSGVSWNNSILFLGSAPTCTSLKPRQQVSLSVPHP